MRTFGQRKTVAIVEPPPKELVDSWVDAYRSVGQFVLDEIPFYVRPLAREEYRFAVSRSAGDQFALEDIVCEKALLWPQNLDMESPETPAGLPSRLAQAILDLSGYTKEAQEKMFQAWQDKVFSQEERWDLLIMLAFPNLTYDILDRMQSDEYFHYLAAAELRVRVQLMTSTNPIFSPDELVDLLICTQDKLESRLEEAKESRDKTLEELQAQPQRRPYGRPTKGGPQ